MPDAPAPARHEHFIDWMKATGMTLIVIGHVAGNGASLFNAVSAPVYSKQLGVAFFVFIAGWGLARNRRPRRETAYLRLFEILLFGGLCALLMSVITWFQVGDLAESNYLPLAMGVNVFLNYFPANPTTWYIGMYLHLILLWWLLAPERFGGLALAMLLIVELATRAILIDAGRSFTAYMLVTNWLTVFVAGYLLTRHGDQRNAVRGVALLVLWLALLALWRTVSLRFGLDDDFPTRRAETITPWATSAMVSMIYLLNTLLAFAVFRSLPAPAIVRFISRHTLLIFILHMPLIYGVSGYVYALFEPVWLRKLAMVIVVLGSLSALSAVVHRIVPTARWRELLWQRLAPRGSGG